MAATFVTSPAPAARDLDRDQPGRPNLRLIEGGAGQPGPTRIVYLRRRVVALVLMVTCVVAVAVGAQAALRPLVASPGGGASAVPGVTQSGGSYVVEPGDTLWSVAASLTPADADVRATVDRLAQLNGGSAIAVGQRLVLPD